MGLRFTLWDIMRMVSASGLYLGMGGYGGVGIIGVGGDGGGVCGFGGLPGLSECLGLDRAEAAWAVSGWPAAAHLAHLYSVWEHDLPRQSGQQGHWWFSVGWFCVQNLHTGPDSVLHAAWWCPSFWHLWHWSVFRAEKYSVTFLGSYSTRTMFLLRAESSSWDRTAMMTLDAAFPTHFSG
jgi:hypothetical protein